MQQPKYVIYEPPKPRIVKVGRDMWACGSLNRDGSHRMAWASTPKKAYHSWLHRSEFVLNW